MPEYLHNTGKVYIVGAGPGDPGLITVKGKTCIETADVVVYDYLASSALLTYAKSQTELIYVGKKGGDHTLPQKDINALLVTLAKQGRIVTRLKGGDPFIFGRGGEEVEALLAENIPFEIVPGVTSAIAAPAYAGIPLTHRDFTSTLGIVTGHEDPTKKESQLHWDAIAKGMGTIVFLMGVKNLPHIVQSLITHGRSPDTPIALVRWGTTPQQMTVSGTLATIVEKVNQSGLTAPCVIVVGDVVRFREQMKWFENRPLFGKTIVITRAREQASELSEKLTQLGAYCIEFPVIQIMPAETDDLDKAMLNLAQYHWLVFTSVNGVSYFFDRLFKLGKDVRSLHHIKTACIGPATANRLLSFGIQSDIIPESYRAESIIDAFKNESISERRILLPRAAEARPILPVELSRMGAHVDEVIAYRTVNSNEHVDSISERLENGQIDVITFTSSSTVKHFATLLQQRFSTETIHDLLKKTVIASIGPITSETAERAGIPVHITASKYTIDGLIDAIMAFYKVR
ncbi:MAG: uroporphyrinogen-III C-methyltransferase [Desulfobacterales bacterium]|nr:uroporphyrinogen-III C-methyltransferase [Desulfobacterales bacterium]